MLGKMGKARGKATRLAAILLTVIGIMQGLTAPAWPDIVGDLPFSSSTSQSYGFSADICVTTLSAEAGIYTTNSTNLHYTLPTFTASINLGKINPYTSTSIILQPQVQFNTAPTFTVTDNISFRSGLTLSGFGQNINITLPNSSDVPFGTDGFMWTSYGSKTFQTTATGTAGLGSGTQTLSQTGNSGTLWSVGGNGLSFLSNYAGIIPGIGTAVATAADILQTAGFYFNPTLGINLLGNYSLALNTSLASLSNLTLGGAPGQHTLSVTDPLTISLSASANYLYYGHFYVSYGDHLSLGPFSWDAIGPNTLGDTQIGTWSPTQSTASAATQLTFPTFAVDVLYEIPNNWDNPNGSTLSISGNRDNTIPLNNAGYMGIINGYYSTGKYFDPGTLNNNAGGILNNAYQLTIESEGTLNNNAGGTLNNNAGASLNVAGTLNNNSGSTLTNSGTIYVHDISSGGTLYNNAGAVLTNNASGTLSFYHSGMDNSGTLTNFGKIIMDYGGVGIEAGGTMTNTGTITMDHVSGLVNFASGSLTKLTNSGTINLKNDSGLYNYGTFDNSGTVNNYGGTQTVGGLYNEIGGTLNNKGIIINYDSGTQIVNYGLLNNFWDLSIGFGTLYNDLNGILNNSGYIGLTSSSGTLNNTGNATLNNTHLLQSIGVINNSATLNNTASGTLINNYGTLNNTAGGVLNNSGTLNNQNTSTLTNNAGAELNNDGTLTNTAYSYIKNYGTLNNNAGYLLTNDATSYLKIYAGGTLNNSGLLRNLGGSTGYIYMEAGGTLNNEAGGTLSNSGTLYNYTGTLNNSGTLTNSGEVTGRGAYMQTAGYTVNYGRMETGAMTIDGGAFYMKSSSLVETLKVYGPLNIGDSGTATFYQEDGNVVATETGNDITLGGSAGGSGTYILKAGDVGSQGSLYVGKSGTGTFIQEGGYNGSSITLGKDAGGVGTYELSQGQVAIGGHSLTIGYAGLGTFTQTGGFVGNGGSISLGYESSGNGTYMLQDGTISIESLLAGYQGNGTFVQTGGSNTVRGYSLMYPDCLNIAYQAGSNSLYQLVDGVLTVGKASSPSWTMVVGRGGIGSFIMGQDPNDPTATHAPSFTLYGNLLVGDQPNSNGLVAQYGGTALVTGNITLGNNTYSSGTYTQSAGTNQILGDLYLGYNGSPPPPPVVFPARGIYNLSDTGSLSATNQYIGYGGFGAFTQSGGTNTVSNSVYLGYNQSGIGSYDLSGNGILSAPNLYVGFNGAGTFTQSGDSQIVSAVKQYVGFSGPGTVTQTGGSNTIGDSLYLGGSTFATGTYNLGGNGSLSAPAQLIGYTGAGIFNQAGGTNASSWGIFVGNGLGSQGTHNLSDGNLSAWNQYVGWFGTGTFNQTGGNVTVNNSLNIGIDPQGSGTYTMDQGSLSIQDLTIGSPGNGSITGTLNITNALAQVSVGGSLTINEGGRLIASPGVTINMTGANFYDYNPNDDLSNLTLLFSNPQAVDTLGFAGSLTLGMLDLTNGAKVKFEDLLTSPHQIVLYIANLILEGDSTLYLSNLDIDLHYGTLSGTGQIVAGAAPVPLPASAWLLLTGLAGLGLLGRRRKGNTG